ncbi:hypothetical protein CANCADRAFT_18013, partial [Tortispora caseinolytica NRRL Y-17796]
KRQKYALKEKFDGDRWRPQKRLSPDMIDMIRSLKHMYPEIKSGDIAERVKVSPESVRRILRSKWEPTDEEKERMTKKWQ